MRITEFPSPISIADRETIATPPAVPAAFTALCDHFGTTGEIDWEAGVAKLDQASHRTPLLLRFAPRGDGSASDQIRQSDALTRLIEGLSDVLRQADHWKEPDRRKLPRSFELDGDVLRLDQLKLARRAADGSQWRCHIPATELDYLLKYFTLESMRPDGSNRAFETQPLRGDRSTPTDDVAASATRRVRFPALATWGARDRPGLQARRVIASLLTEPARSFAGSRELRTSGAARR